MTLDIRTNPDHSGKWLCPSCNTWCQDQVTACSWCGKPKPAASTQQQEDGKNARITQLLHQSIEKMSYPQKVKTWKWLEDNVI